MAVLYNVNPAPSLPHPMNPDQYAHVEQDYSAPADGGELPTYEDLTAQNGPNSRFVL